KPPAPEKGRNPQGGKNAGGGMEGVEVPLVKMTTKARKGAEEDPDDFAKLARAEPSALQLQLRELEERFVSLEGTLDAPERQALWPELAALNTALGVGEDAGICWANALWAQDDAPSSWFWGWFRSEASAVPAREGKGRARPHSWAAAASLATGGQREVSGED